MIFFRSKHIAENIIGTLSGVNGHTYDIIFDLIFTSERVVTVIIRHPNDISPLRGTEWQTMLLGTWLTKNKELIERSNISDQRRQACRKLSLDELVASHPYNHQINYNSVITVEIKRGWLQSQLIFSISHPSGSRQIKYYLSKQKIPEAKRLLEKVLLPKIKGR